MKWPTGALDSIAIFDRQSIHPSEAEAATPYLGLEHLDGDGGIDCIQTVGSAGLKSNKFQFSDRHVLFGKLRPYLRKIVRPEFSGVCSTDIIPILPKEGVSRDYLFYFLRTPDIVNLATSRCSGANLPRLGPKQLASFQIPLPPLAEQKRIAAILDAADALLAKRREALAQLDTLLQSTFIDMFGDPVTNPMGWEMVNGGRVSRRLTVGIVVKPASYYQPTGVPAIRSLNVRTNKIEIASLVYVSAENNEGRLKKTRVWKDDVLLVRSGQPGTAAVVPAELDGVNAIDILILTPDQHVAHPVYLSNYFNSAGGKRMVLGAQRGQIQKHLNVGSLRSAPIPLPPFDLQCRFAAIVESVECQKASQRAHLDELDTLFASLQSRAFRGDL